MKSVSITECLRRRLIQSIIGLRAAILYTEFGQIVTLGDFGQHQQVAQPAIGEHVQNGALGIQHCFWIVVREDFYPYPEKQYPA
jgi:hypothetical protein